MWLFSGKKRLPNLLLLAEETGRSKKFEAVQKTSTLSDCVCRRWKKLLPLQVFL